MLSRDNLRRVFTLQEERRLTSNVTLHYKRVMYVIEPGPIAESAPGKRVLVREDDSGQVFIEYRGAALSARAFPKDARVRQSQAGLPHRRGTKKARRADLDQDTEPDNCISQRAGHL